MRHQPAAVAQLDFQFAHAQARDAVHLPLDCAALTAELDRHGLACLPLHSAASDRQTYLQRPDLGRRLGRNQRRHARRRGRRRLHDLALVIDGLSALAVQRHAAPMALKIAEQCQAEGWSLGPVALVEQGRVAVADEIGQRLKARAWW